MLFEMCLPTTKLLLSFIVALQAGKKKKRKADILSHQPRLSLRYTTD